MQDGAHHEVDSSDWAFYQATQFAFEECYEAGQWQILEPIMLVEVSVPDEFSSSASGIVTKRNGVIVSSESVENWFTVSFEAPLNDMFGFASELRSATQGKGEYTMEYSRYAPTLPHVQDKIVEEYKNRLIAESAGTSTDPKKKKKKN